MSRTFESDKLGKSDYYKQKAEKEMREYYDNKTREVKNTYENQMTSIRDDLYKKEREIQDYKNQINLLNLRLTKENEQKQSTEDILRKNKEKFAIDTHKYNNSYYYLKDECEKIKDSLKDKEKILQNGKQEIDKLNTESNSINNEMIDLKKRMDFELNDKNRIINNLLTDFKKLQDNLCESNNTYNSLENKQKILSKNNENGLKENYEIISRMRSENEKLSQENQDLHYKTSLLSKELEENKMNFDKNNYDNEQNISRLEKEISNANQNSDSAMNVTENLEREIKESLKQKNENENYQKDERLSQESKLNEINNEINSKNMNLSELAKKQDQIQSLQSETQRDNEKILRDFDDFKRHQNVLLNQKDNEITNFKGEVYQSENKLKELASKIKSLDEKIKDGENMQIDLKDRMNSDLDNQVNKFNALSYEQTNKEKESRETNDKLKDEISKNEELSIKFKMNTDELREKIRQLRDDCDRSNNKIEELLRDNKNMESKVSQLNIDKKSVESELNALQRKDEYTTTDMNNTISRLENENRSLCNQRDEQSKNLNDLKGDHKTLLLESKYHRDESNKNEALFQDKICRLNGDLCKENEIYRNLQNSYKSKQKLLYEAESQGQKLISEEKIQIDKENHQTEKLRNLEDELKYFSTDIKKNLTKHIDERGKSFNEAKIMIKDLSNEIQKATLSEEFKDKEENWIQQKKRLDELDAENRSKEQRNNDLANYNQLIKNEVNVNNKSKVDYENSLKAQNELKDKYDKLQLENSRIRASNQNAERTLRDTKSEIIELRDNIIGSGNKHNSIDRFGSPHKYGSSHKYGSPIKD